MIPLLLLVFFVFSLGSTQSPVTIDQLTWQPELITKESILANYLKLTDEPLYDGFTQLAFITTWNPRGFMLARKRAARLSFVSPVWFELQPTFDMEGKMSNVAVAGASNMNTDFIRTLRKSNPDIKIVPRFYFQEIAPWVAERFIKKEVVVQRVAQTIANFCHKYGFDGLVLDIYAAFVHQFADPELKMYVLEMIEQIGNVIRKNDLVAILSFPAPVNVIEYRGEEKQAVTMMSTEECGQLVSAYDHLQLWTYIDASKSNRKYVNDEYIAQNVRLCGPSSKIIIGLSFYGIEFDLDEWREGIRLRPPTPIDSKRFLQVLKQEDSKLEFNREHKEHELTFERNNTFIIFPSLTSLEYRIAVAKRLNVGISFWDYGQGLDYFTNLV